MRLGAVLVHYHTPELLRRCLQLIRAELGEAADLAVVDHGSHPHDQLETLPVRLLRPGHNRGYAAGVNSGMRECSADVIFLINPDVEIVPGCLQILLKEMHKGGWAACGPRLCLDAAGQVLHPPPEDYTRLDELARRLARFGSGWQGWARRRWRRQAERHWNARQPLPSSSLCGAVLALSRQAWEKVGPMDEGFFLYFEETDWLIRLRRAGLRSAYVPQARAVHHFAQSSRQVGEAPTWFAASFQRFARRHYGATFCRALGWLDRLGREPQPQALPLGSAPPRLACGPGALELTNQSRGFPAARIRLDGDSWSFPPESWPYLSPGRWYVRHLDPQGRERSLYWFDKHE